MGQNGVLEAGKAAPGQVCGPAGPLERSSGALRARRGCSRNAWPPARGSQATRGPSKLRSPVGPHCSGSPLHRPGPRWPSVRPQKRKQTHRPSFLLLFLAALPSSARAGSEERRAHPASRAWPPALVCRELTKGTSGQRVSAQWRELQFISILLLFDVHTPALFTTK